MTEEFLTLWLQLRLPVQVLYCHQASAMVTCTLCRLMRTPTLVTSLSDANAAKLLSIKHLFLEYERFACPPAGPPRSIQTQITSHLLASAQAIAPRALCILTSVSYSGHIFHVSYC